MQCRQCGTEIAEKALICYRCGTATTEAKYKPASPSKRTASRMSLIVVTVIALAIALLLVAYLLLDMSAVSSDPGAELPVEPNRHCAYFACHNHDETGSWHHTPGS
jgi:uncharacterized membrane protein YvbJ